MRPRCCHWPALSSSSPESACASSPAFISSFGSIQTLRGIVHYNTSRSINYEYLGNSNPFFIHIFETVVYTENDLNVSLPMEKSAHTWSISALEPMDRIWMRPSSTSFFPAWEMPWWDSATGGLLSSERQQRKNFKRSLYLKQCLGEEFVSHPRFCHRPSPPALSP